MIVCEVLETEVENEEKTMLVYGFRFIQKESGETICILPDVFTEKEKALALKELIEKNAVDAAHILDVIEDALAE